MNQKDNIVESRLYCCFNCRNVVAIQDDIVNKDFVAGGRRAFLFSHVKNVVEGVAEDRDLLTGKHNVCDVYCSDCEEELGWKYVKVYRDEHKYKLGKTGLVKCKIDKLANPPPF